MKVRKVANSDSNSKPCATAKTSRGFHSKSCGYFCKIYCVSTLGWTHSTLKITAISRIFFEQRSPGDNGFSGS